MIILLTENNNSTKCTIVDKAMTFKGTFEYMIATSTTRAVAKIKRAKE